MVKQAIRDLLILQAEDLRIRDLCHETQKITMFHDVRKMVI